MDISTVTKEEITSLARAYTDMQQIKQGAINRAKVWLSLQYKNESNLDPYLAMDVALPTLLFGKSSYVSFDTKDSQGDYSNSYYIPRDFLFQDPTEEEKECAEFIRLSKKFNA